MAKRRTVKVKSLKKPLLKLIIRGGKFDLNLDILLDKLYLVFSFYIFSGLRVFFSLTTFMFLDFMAHRRWHGELFCFVFGVDGWVVFWGWTTNPCARSHLLEKPETSQFHYYWWKLLFASTPPPIYLFSPADPPPPKIFHFVTSYPSVAPYLYLHIQILFFEFQYFFLICCGGEGGLWSWVRAKQRRLRAFSNHLAFRSHGYFDKLDSVLSNFLFYMSCCE